MFGFNFNAAVRRTALFSLPLEIDLVSVAVVELAQNHRLATSFTIGYEVSGRVCSVARKSTTTFTESNTFDAEKKKLDRGE